MKKYALLLGQWFKNVFFLVLKFKEQNSKGYNVNSPSKFKKKHKVVSLRRLNKAYWRERTRTRPDYWYGYIFRFFYDYSFWGFRVLVRIWLNLLLFLEIEAFFNIVGIFRFIVVVGGVYIFLKLLLKIVLPVLLWKLFLHYFPQTAQKWHKNRLALVSGHNRWLRNFFLELIFGWIVVFVSIVFIGLWLQFGVNFLDLFPIVLVEPVFIDDINAVYIFL